MTELFRDHLSGGGHQRIKINVSTPEANFNRRHRLSDKCCGEYSQRNQLFLNLKRRIKESRPEYCSNEIQYPPKKKKKTAILTPFKVLFLPFSREILIIT